MIYTENCFVNGLKFNLETLCYVRHRTLSCSKFSPSLIKIIRKITCGSKFAQIKFSNLIYFLYGYNVHVHLIKFFRSCTCRSAYMYFHLQCTFGCMSNAIKQSFLLCSFSCFFKKFMPDMKAFLSILERRMPFLSTHSLCWACTTFIKVIMQVQSLDYKKKILQILIPYQRLQKLWNILFVNDILEEYEQKMESNYVGTFIIFVNVTTAVACLISQASNQQ